MEYVSSESTSFLPNEKIIDEIIKSVVIRVRLGDGVHLKFFQDLTVC